MKEREWDREEKERREGEPRESEKDRREEERERERNFYFAVPLPGVEHHYMRLVAVDVLSRYQPQEVRILYPVS